MKAQPYRRVGFQGGGVCLWKAVPRSRKVHLVCRYTSGPPSTVASSMLGREGQSIFRADRYIPTCGLSWRSRSYSSLRKPWRDRGETQPLPPVAYGKSGTRRCRLRSGPWRSKRLHREQGQSRPQRESNQACLHWWNPPIGLKPRARRTRPAFRSRLANHPRGYDRICSRLSAR